MKATAFRFYHRSATLMKVLLARAHKFNMKHFHVLTFIMLISLSITTAVGTGPYSSSAFKAMSFVYRISSTVWRQRSMAIMDTRKFSNAMGSIQNVRNTICREATSICVPDRSKYTKQEDYVEVQSPATMRDEAILMSRRKDDCGRGIAMDGRCVCPIDFFGEHCDRPRNFHCRFTRVVPEKCNVAKIVSFDKGLDGDAPCISYPKNGSEPLSLGYKLSCSLDVLHKTTEEVAYTMPFKYALRKNSSDSEKTFALSELPDDKIIFRPYNWDRPFSDRSFTQTRSLTKEMLLGAELVRFSVPLGNMLRASPGYSRGGRFFAEVRLLGNGDARISRATDCWPCVARVFVEISG